MSATTLRLNFQVSVDPIFEAEQAPTPLLVNLDPLSLVSYNRFIEVSKLDKWNDRLAQTVTNVTVFVPPTGDDIPGYLC